MPFDRVKDGDQLPFDDVLVYESPAARFGDIALWVARDDSAAAVAVLVSAVAQLIDQDCGKSIGVHRTTLLPHQRFGGGRHSDTVDRLWSVGPCARPGAQQDDVFGVAEQFEPPESAGLPLLGVAQWVLLTSAHRLLRWLGRLAAYGYATFYTGLDAVAGIAAGTVE